MNFNQFNPQISLSKNLSAVTACDDLGTVTKTRLGFRREKCNSFCSEGIDEDTCRDVKFGVVGRNGECYLNSDQIMKYKGHTEDDQFFVFAKYKSDNEFDGSICFCFYLLDDIWNHNSIWLSK